MITDPSSTTVWQTSAHRINTGTIDHTTDTAAGTWSYSYDPLNRLLTSTGPHGSTSYTTDAFGNKYLQTVTAGVGQPQTGPPPTPQNTLPGNGLTYEITYTSGGTQINQGGITYDGFHHYLYDAEDRLYSVDGTTCYTYDGVNAHSKLTPFRSLGIDPSVSRASG